MFILVNPKKAIKFITYFSLLISLITSSEQSCKTLKYIEICYITQNQQTHFSKCLTSQCSQYSLQHDQCLHQKILLLSQTQCSQKLCNKNTLSQCLLTLKQNSNTSQTDEKNRLMKIYIGSAVSFVCLVILLVVCRKVRYKERVQHSPFMQANSTSINNSSIASIFVGQTQELVNHQNKGVHSIDQLSTFQYINAKKQLKKRKQVLQSPQTDSLASFAHQEDLHIQDQINDLNEQLKKKICCICLSSDKIDLKTSCGHFYHIKCLEQWLLRKQQCPQCRSKKFAPLESF